MKMIQIFQVHLSRIQLNLKKSSTKNLHRDFSEPQFLHQSLYQKSQINLQPYTQKNANRGQIPAFVPIPAEALIEHERPFQLQSHIQFHFRILLSKRLLLTLSSKEEIIT